MLSAREVHKPWPFGWDPQGALTLPDIWFWVEKHRASVPMSAAMFVTICFEETACSNSLQKENPFGIGPGQLQVSEHDKVEFFASEGNFLGRRWDSSQTLPEPRSRRTRENPLNADLHNPLTREFILANNEFSIQMHLKYFEWLTWDKNVKGPDGLLGAQTEKSARGAKARDAFRHGAPELDKLMQTNPPIDFGWSDVEKKAFYAKRRKEFVHVLNIARVDFRGKDAAVPEYFQTFWEFFLPDGFLESPLGYVKWGF